VRRLSDQLISPLRKRVLICVLPKFKTMTVIGVCGKLCDKCPLYGSECEGCLQEMKMSSRYKCEVYRCAVAKGLESCAGCDEYDCLITTKHRSLCPLLVEKAAQPVARRVHAPDSPVQ
jgi:hypothetical protein